MVQVVCCELCLGKVHKPYLDPTITACTIVNSVEMVEGCAGVLPECGWRKSWRKK